MEFNLVRYLELLRKYSDFKGNNSNFHKTSPDEYKEFSNYCVMVQNDREWQNREKLIGITKKFLSKEISNETYCDQIIDMHYNLVGKLSKFKSDVLSGTGKVEKIETDLKKQSITLFFSDTFDRCNNDYFTPELFYNEIKKDFQKLEKILDYSSNIFSSLKNFPNPIDLAVEDATFSPSVLF